eukprot:s3416_g3.t1
MCGARPKLRSAKPLVIKHTAAVSALTRRSQWAQALSRFGTAFGERGLSPDAPALGAGLAACAKGAQWAQALHLFTSAAVKNAACFGTLLHAFASAARWHEALASLTAAEDPDIVAFNTTINACTRGAAWPAALGVFAEAEARRLPATSITYNTTATACLRGSLWHVAMELARRGEEVEAEGASPASLGAALASCERASLWDKAIWLLYQAGTTDSWDVAAGGSAVASCGALQWAQALSLFETLSSYALVDYVTRSSLVTVCRRAWQWRTAAALAASPAADPATIALGIDVCEAAQAPNFHRQRLRRCLIRRAVGTTVKDPGGAAKGVKKATVLTPQDLVRILVFLFQLDLGVAQICLWAYLSCARIVEVLTASMDVKGNRFRVNKEQGIMHMLRIQKKGGKVKDAKASMLLKTEHEEKEFLERIAKSNLFELIETPPFENRWSDADSFVRRLKGLLKGTQWEYMNITGNTFRRCRITHLADQSPP